MISRQRFDPQSPTARSTIDMPAPVDIDLAPQLVVVALAQAALAATHRALDSAHPLLAPDSSPSPPMLDDKEHCAILVLRAASSLAALLDDYAHAILADNDSDSLPF